MNGRRGSMSSQSSPPKSTRIMICVEGLDSARLEILKETGFRSRTTLEALKEDSEKGLENDIGEHTTLHRDLSAYFPVSQWHHERRHGSKESAR